MSDTPNQVDKLTVTQADRDAADGFCTLNMLTGPTWRERVSTLLARHRITHSGEGRSNGDELCCDQCGRGNPVWFAPSDIWNLAVGGPDATDDPGGILCPACFIAKAEAAGIKPNAWRLEPEGRSNGVGEDLGDLEWTEDGYSLRTKYDGDVCEDVDGYGRSIVVGGDLVLTFDDSQVADEYRERIIAALATHQGEGERLREMALTDDPDWIAAGIPDDAIEAGMQVFRRVDADNENYVAGETTDWDEGMIVAAIFKAVARAALAQPEAGGERE